MSGPVVLGLRAILAIALYVFLAWALLTLWREIRQQGTMLVSRKIPPISLSILDPNSGSRLCHFTHSEVTIGRDSTCECRIYDDSISAYHARLNYHHGLWWLEDLGSTNGTSLNQEKLLLPTILVAGDEIRCGETRLIVVSSGNPLSPTHQLTSP
jgi:pSer/pThr/pTyr-binding forkhead associated (FHA) protein